MSGVVLVTGASGGMGLALARDAAARGQPLVTTDLRPEPLEAAAAQLRAEHGAEVRVVAGDLTAETTRGALVAALDGQPIALLAHAAGVAPTLGDGPRIVDINLTGTLRLLEHLRPHMAPGGVAVLIASMAGHGVRRWPFEGVAQRMAAERATVLDRQLWRNPGLAYGLSKRAVQIVAERQVTAFGEVGARIVSLSPGIIRTPMGERERAAHDVMDKMLAVTPGQAMGEPEDIAAAVAFLASPAARYVNGTDLLVDGGTTAAVAAAGGVMGL